MAAPLALAAAPIVSKDAASVTNTAIDALARNPQIVTSLIAGILAAPIGLYLAMILQWNLEHIAFHPQNSEHPNRLERIDKPEKYSQHTLAPPFITNVMESQEAAQALFMSTAQTGTNFSNWLGQGAPIAAPGAQLATPYSGTPLEAVAALQGFLNQLVGSIQGSITLP